MTLPWSDLHTEIDVDRLRAALQRALPADQHLEALRVLKVRRSASHQRDPHPLRLSLQARWHDRRRQRQGWQQLYAKVYRGGHSAAALAAARALPSSTPDFGEALCHVGELDLLLWAWPNDPGLPQLPQLLQPARAWAGVPSLADRPVQVVEVMRYEPEQRATLRYRVGHGSAAYGVVAKTFGAGHEHQARTLQQRFAAVQALADTAPDAPVVARVLGVDDATATLVQLQAHGVPMSELVDDPRAADTFAIVGRALARLHATPPCGAGTRDAAHWHTEIERRQRKIARGAPALAARVEALARRLHDTAAAVPPQLSLIHGDFHADQVQIDGGRALFFDFDEFCQGHPMEDLASFGVKLEQARPGGRGAALARAVERAYRDTAPSRWCATALAWHRALQALLQAARAFVFQVPGWPRELQQRLARAEALALEIFR